MSNEPNVPRSVSLPPQLVAQLEDMAELHDVSVSQIVRIALFHYLNSSCSDVYTDPYNVAPNASDK